MKKKRSKLPPLTEEAETKRRKIQAIERENEEFKKTNMFATIRGKPSFEKAVRIYNGYQE